MRKREFATCVALRMAVINRSVSDLSLILINSKEKFSNSLILDYKNVSVHLLIRGFW